MVCSFWRNTMVAMHRSVSRVDECELPLIAFERHVILLHADLSVVIRCRIRQSAGLFHRLVSLLRMTVVQSNSTLILGPERLFGLTLS